MVPRVMEIDEFQRSTERDEEREGSERTLVSEAGGGDSMDLPLECEQCGA